MGDSIGCSLALRSISLKGNQVASASPSLTFSWLLMGKKDLSSQENTLRAHTHTYIYIYVGYNIYIYIYISDGHAKVTPIFFWLWKSWIYIIWNLTVVINADLLQHQNRLQFKFGQWVLIWAYKWVFWTVESELSKWVFWTVESELSKWVFWTVESELSKWVFWTVESECEHHI